MKKYKLLGIAPYEGFKGYLLNSINKRNDLEAEVYSAELASAVDLVHSLDLSKYDVVISRGSTGHLIQKEIDLPFVNVEFSGYDILRSLKLAQYSQNRKIAFVTFIDLVQNVEFLMELLEYKDKITLPPAPKTPEEMDRLINDLYYNEGIQLFIGDGACVKRANALGAETILITSGPESMDKAVEEAIDILSYKKKFEKKNQFYHSLLEQTDIQISLFDKSGNLIYSKLFTHNKFSEIHDILKRHTEKVFSDEYASFTCGSSNNTWKIDGKLVSIGGEPYALFTIKNTFSKSESKDLSYSLIEQKFTRESLSLISANLSLSETLERVRQWAKTISPLFIHGGSGTGKKTFAYAAYDISKNANESLICIECSSVDAKALATLFEDKRSLLNETGNTILLNKINTLSLEMQNKLDYYLNTNNTLTNNRIISTFSGDIQFALSNNSFSKDLYSKLSATTVYLPPLHDRKEDIPAMARNFLTNANQQMTVQIVGFESEAMEILQNTTWKYGINQLNSILKQLVLTSKNQFITAEKVKSVLSQFEINETCMDAPSAIDLSKTLDEISISIINMVLAEEKGNQSKTAKRLGISRSTLWKKLNS